MGHAFSTPGQTLPMRCRTQCRLLKTAEQNISFFGKRLHHRQRFNSKKSAVHSTRKVLKVGHSQLVPPTSTATCCQRSISPTTSVPIAYCTTSPHPVIRVSSCWKDDDRSLPRSRKCWATTRTRAWELTSAI